MATDWTEQANQMFKVWSDSQRAWLESLARVPAGAANPFATSAPAQESAKQLSDAWQASVEQWMTLLNQAAPFAFSQDNVRKLIDPTEWAKPVPGSFDFGFERLMEGPTFASQPELQIKMMKLQQLGQKRTQDSAAYHAVVLAAWREAAERFVKEMSDPQREPVETFRALTDRWVKVANDTLIEVHRSPQFLEAQQRLTRSTTEYRLLEREIAEAYCELGHVPTRTEMDEVQRRVVELRRELRALQRQVNAKKDPEA